MSMNLKAMSAKSCEYNWNFYKYKIITVTTTSSLQVHVEKCWNVSQAGGENNWSVILPTTQEHAAPEANMESNSWPAGATSSRETSQLLDSYS